MKLTSFTCLLLGVCCITTGVQGRIVWPFYDPFEKIFHPSGGGEGSGGSNSPTESSPNPATSLQKSPAAPAKASTDTSAASENSETEIRKLIEEELKKFQTSNGKSDKLAKYSLNSPSEAAGTTTENSADLFRRIIAEELAKALPETTPTTSPSSSSPSSPPEPLWKQWAKTKKWAKQPGPNGQEAPGFLGTLRSRYGAGGYGGPYGYPGRASGETPASGSPGWVWSQIANKWSSKDPTAVPPPQIVDKGDWIVIQPPHQPTTPPAKS